MTYNQWNKGMSSAHLNPNFEYVNRNQYRYLGNNFEYTGDIFNKVKGSALIKIGYWLNGNVYDFNNQLANYNFDINVLKKNNNDSDNDVDFLLKIGFNESGKYFLKNGKIEVTNIKKERVSLVYAFVVNNKVCYFGKTVQGYIRPFTYHKNEIMKTVKKGITEHVINNCEVLIFTRPFKQQDFIMWNGLNLNIIEAVEQSLINKFNPNWNNYKHK
jgi:hypothetical protein